MKNNQSNLFLLVKEGPNIIAYPVIVMFPQDETGYRYITFMPLTDLRDKTPNALSIVHRVNLNHFGDTIEIKDAEIPFSDENSLLISLCNMLVGPRYQYIQGIETKYQEQYECFVESICHVAQEFLKSKPSQKHFLGTTYSMIQKTLNIFNASQSEVIEFMAILDEIINAMIDKDGIITSDSVEAARQYLIEPESEPIVEPEPENDRLGWSETDAQFFTNLL